MVPLAASSPDLLALGLPLLAGAAAILLLLPRPYGNYALLGAVTGLVALVLAGWFLLRTVGISLEIVLFYLFSALAIVSASLLVTQQNPARAALAFALVVLSTSGLYLILAAPFLMAASIVIYAGAIVVTFLFVLMLAQQESQSNADARSREPVLATATGFVLLGALLYVLHVAYEGSENIRLADAVLAKVRATQAQLARGDTAGIERFQEQLKRPINEALDALDRSEAELRQGTGGYELRALLARAEFARGLRERIETLLTDFPDSRDTSPARLLEAVDRVGKSLAEARQQQGWLQPSSELPLSNLSGPAANLPADQFRTDNQGRPHLPAENVHYVGKSLFTDFLLPVELGGTLLLVATVGAIAIAQRRRPEARRS